MHKTTPLIKELTHLSIKDSVGLRKDSSNFKDIQKRNNRKKLGKSIFLTRTRNTSQE